MTDRILLALALCLTLVLVGVPSASAQQGNAPQPSTVQKSWQFNFTYGKPQPILVRDVDGSHKWYWYLTYKVVNKTNDERNFIPDVAIATDQGDIISAGAKVPVQVFDEVKKAVGIRLLESPNEVIGRLLIGEDLARESVIIWPAFEHDIDHLSIMIAGLSGETVVIPNPLTGEDVVFRKTLKLDYTMPGTGGPVKSQAILPAGESWIMR